jgi:hypothetical protein
MLRVFLVSIFILGASLEARAIGFGRVGTGRVSPLEVSKEPVEFLDLIRKATDRIVKFGAGSKSLYVAIGASPLIIAADLESRLGSRNVVKLPLSAAQFLRAPTIPFKTIDRVMFPYLDFFLGAYNFDQIDQVVLLDFAASGSSLAGTRDLVERYFRLRGWRHTAIRIVAFSGNSKIANMNLSLKIHLSDDSHDRFFSREYAYLRQFEKETVHQWLNWFEQHTFSDDDDLAKQIADRIKQSRLPDGEERYRRAVDFFSQHPRPKSFLDKMRRHCEAWLSRGDDSSL